MSLVVSWITVIYHISKKSIIYICKASLSLLAGVRVELSQAVRGPGMATTLALHRITVGRRQKAWYQPCTFRITKWRLLGRAYSSSDGQRSHANVFLPWASQGVGNQVENSKAEDKLVQRVLLLPSVCCCIHWNLEEEYPNTVWVFCVSRMDESSNDIT